MKKSVWMSKLEQILTEEGMTNAEKRTVMNFYEEMYQDKHDDGMSEEDIIKEFGFPEDVALNVRESGEHENASNTDYVSEGYVIPPSPPVNGIGAETQYAVPNNSASQNEVQSKPTETAKKSVQPKKLISGALSVATIIAAIALLVFGVILAISGVATVICGFIVISFSAGAWLIAFGIGLILFAVGSLIFNSGLRIIKSATPSKGGAK